MLAVVGAGLGYLIMRVWLKYRQGTNYDFNIFEDPELSTIDKLSMRSMYFKIPSIYKKKVQSTKGFSHFKGEQLMFEQKKGEFIGKVYDLFLALKLNSSLGKVTQYKYFEIDLVEIPNNSKVYIGLCEKNNFQNNKLPNITNSTVILDGFSGKVTVGKKIKNFDFRMRYFGDVGGILLYQDREFIERNE